jgi:Zn-dependent peptidase ImmA (M78 family)
LALWPNEIKKRNIEEHINELLGDLHLWTKAQLNIEDIKYEIVLESVRIKGGSPDTTFIASGVPNVEKNQIEKIVFFTESISLFIKNIFSKVHETDVFYELAKYYVKFAFIHELIHVQQLKNGMTLEEYFATNYEDSKWEKEANESALMLLKSMENIQDNMMEIFIKKLGIFR